MACLEALVTNKISLVADNMNISSICPTPTCVWIIFSVKMLATVHYYKSFWLHFKIVGGHINNE